MVKHKQSRKSERARGIKRSRPASTVEAKTDRRDLSELNVPVSRFQRLANAIAAGQDLPESMSLSHEECEALLEFYVDSERQGEQFQKLYPSVRQHLQGCDRCRLSYTLLAESLREVSVTSVPDLHPEPLPALSFLTPSTLDVAWTKYYQPRIRGAAMAFGFTIRPSYLQQLFASPALATRGEPTSEHSLLLSDTFSFRERQIDVEIWAHRSGDASQVRLEIFLVSSVPLPEPLHVVLKWDEQHISVPIQQGRATIEGLVLSDLGQALDLRVELEIDSQT